MKTISGSTILSANTNVLNYTAASVSNAAGLEAALEAGPGIIKTDGALAENDAFIIQYQDLETNQYSYAVAFIDGGGGVAANTFITSWEVIDIATTNQSTAFLSSQFAFID